MLTKLAIAAFLASCLLGGPRAMGDPSQALDLDPGPGERLAEAREDLRISELTFRRIQRQLEALRQRPDLDHSVIDDYSIYLERVRSMLAATEESWSDRQSLVEAIGRAGELLGEEVPDE